MSELPDKQGPDKTRPDKTRPDKTGPDRTGPDTRRPARRREDHFSCAFCNDERPKPFKICESCGTPQPADADGEEE